MRNPTRSTSSRTPRYHDAPTTRGVCREIRQRELACTPTGRPVLEVLEGLARDVELAMLVGPPPAAGWRPWALEGLSVPGCPWESLESYYEGHTPVLRYRHVASGRRLEVQHADAWFAGCAGYSAELAERALAELVLELRRHAAFRGAVLLNTPASTGRDLWLRAIGPGRGWPVLPESMRELIRTTTGQGRIELVAHPKLAEIPALYEYDGRLMYAALAWGLPGGIPEWVAGDALEYDEYAAARYLVRAMVPTDWPLPFGLLGVKGERGAWRYPHEPGEVFTTWCDGAELQLVRHVWGPHSCEIGEALVWPRYTGKGPLDSWANALVTSRERWRDRGELGELVRAAIRSIVLHGIGALASSSHRVTRYAATVEDLPPEHRRRARPEPGGGFTYPVDTAPPWELMQHPELSAAVWGRARRRLLAGPGRVGALHAAGEVVAFRTDAIYTTEPQTWGDDGRSGRFRLKRHGRGPFATPRTSSELLTLRGGLS